VRIAVCNSQVPFEYGGAEILADALVEQLRRYGHETTLVRIPMRWYPAEEILKGYLGWRLVNLDESEGRPIDRVIALKFPAFAVRHAHKTTWLIQQLRQAYDLLGTEHSYLSPATDASLVDTVRRMDTRTIGESQRIYAISDNVGQRLHTFNGLQAETLYPPPAMDGQLHHESYDDYILSVCRLNKLKRVDHLIEAIARTRTSVRCLVVGRGEEQTALEKLASSRGVRDRVQFLGYVSNEDAVALYAKARAVYYAPLDEDYGLATVEAMKSRKPVLTTDDSGGVLEFVRDSETGFVMPAQDVGALAQRIDELMTDEMLARRLGAAGEERVQGINWSATIRRLLEP
jgi:glycosyltransferase involved in cell wall biosynthesis